MITQLQKNLKKNSIAWLFLGIYFAVSFVNDGFIAVDEYWEGIVRYIPAQSTSLMGISHDDDVKSPTQTLPLFMVAKLAYNLGAESPIWQYRFAILFFGVLAGLLYFLSSRFVFRGGGHVAGQSISDADWSQKCLLLTLAFHFASVGVLTRPMFEALSASWLFLAVSLALFYDRNRGESFWPLVAGAIAASMAFAARPQTGMVALIFLILPLVHKRFRHALGLVGVGIVLFVLMGLPDLYIRGGFHYSLKAVFGFNIAHGGNYTNQPWWFYFPLMIVVTLLPWFIARYPKNVWDEFKQMRAVWISLALFLLPHLIFKNKFERFLIPVIPVMLLLLQPFARHLWENRKTRAWRVKSFLTVNALLWFSVAWMPPQKNLLRSVEYLDKSKDIHQAYVVSNIIEWLPDAFVGRKDLSISYLKIAPESFAAVMDSCDAVVIMGKAEFELNQIELPKWNVIETFNVNWIEGLSYRLNPRRNERRQALVALYPTDFCQ